MATSIFCLARSDAVAQRILQRLREIDIRNDAVSVLFPDTTTSKDFAYEKHTKAPEGASTGGVAGGLVGGALGWLVGIGSLAIPGVGPFIAAGPIMAALGGVAIGATVGGLTGTFIGLGIPEFEAKRYEGKIREGRILISVHADDGRQIARIRDVFKAEGAEDIASAGEASAPKVKVADHASD